MKELTKEEFEILQKENRDHYYNRPYPYKRYCIDYSLPDCDYNKNAKTPIKIGEKIYYDYDNYYKDRLLTKFVKFVFWFEFICLLLTFLSNLDK